jgi:hypothetical protein
MKKLLPIIITFLILSCKNEVDSKSVIIESNISESTSEASEEWLIKTIQDFFIQDFPKMEQITTKRYAEYKQDAIGMEYDGLTPEQFKTKWETQYDISLVGSGSFLIAQQDNGEIRVTKCNLINSNDNEGHLFEVIISDVLFNLDHKRVIKVIKVNDNFLIDDVRDVK